MHSFQDFLINEAFQVRVNSKGQKTKRKKCAPGYKLSSDGQHCVKISASEHLTRSKATKRTAKVLKSKHTQIARKRNMAMRKRKGMGL